MPSPSDPHAQDSPSSASEPPRRTLAGPPSDGPRSDPPASSGPDSYLGKTIADRYLLERKLGDGAMGAVFLAEHVALRRRVAIKMLHAELSRQPEVVARFEREAVAAANIDHPNVAAAFDFGNLGDGTFFLALEYVEGRCLRDEVLGPLAPLRAVHILRQITEALVRAHALEIVHRDLKPENIMLVERDADRDFVKVLDFGIARMRFAENGAGQGGAALTRAGMVYGTPEYMAPEQALGLPVDARADLYALGVIGFELLTGTRPFESDDPVRLLGMQITSPFPRFEDVAPELSLPHELSALIYRLTAKSADDRPGDTRAVQSQLEQLERRLEGHLPLAAPVAVPAHMARAQTLPAVRSDGATLFTASSAPSADTLTLLSTIRRILQRTWGEVRPLFHALWLKLPERFRTRRALAITAGSLLGVWLVVWALSAALQPAPTLTAEAALRMDKRRPPVTPASEHQFLQQIKAGELDKARTAIDGSELKPSQEMELRQALVLGYFHAERPNDALLQLEALFHVSPAAAVFPELAAPIEQALLQKESFERTYSYLVSHPSPLAADVFYKILSHKPRYFGAAKLKSALNAPDMVAASSPALAIARELSGHIATNKCNAKPLLGRAKVHGDERTLSQLRPLVAKQMVTKKVGFFKTSPAYDKLACLHSDSELTDTIAAIEKRHGLTPEPVTAEPAAATASATSPTAP